MCNPMTYDQASELAMKAQDPSRGYLLENNTRLVNRGSHFAVRLHNTDVVEIYHDGTYRINAGRWKTVTTKNRINKYSPIRVHQTDFEWFIGDVPFQNRLKVDKDGNIIE